jgi:hypothetical protein
VPSPAPGGGEGHPRGTLGARILRALSLFESVAPAIHGSATDSDAARVALPAARRWLGRRKARSGAQPSVDARAPASDSTRTSASIDPTSSPA